MAIHAGIGWCITDRELRETAARLALAVAERPPADLRTRVLAALPEVRQLPPADGRSPVVQMSSRRRWRYLPHLAMAACLAIAVAAGAIAVDARNATDWHATTPRRRSGRRRGHRRCGRAGRRRPHRGTDRRRHRDGGVLRPVRKGRGALPRPAEAVRLARLPAVVQPRRHDGPGRPGRPGPSSGSMLLDGSTAGADAVGVTAEPHGGSPAPTGTPLALVRL